MTDHNTQSPGDSEETLDSLNLQQPKRIGKDPILEIIGSGGMGDVYLAEQTDPIGLRPRSTRVRWLPNRKWRRAPVPRSG